MMADEDGLQLNVFTGTVHNHQKREKLNKKDRIKKKKEIRRQQNRLEATKTTPVHVKESNTKKTEQNQAVTSQVKRKQEGEESEKPTPKKQKTSSKFSSLFRNNPDIPQVESTRVERVKEDVFSASTFSEMRQLHPHLVSTLEERLGLSHVTSVQQKAIPRLLEGVDALVKSQTGSGKTLAYAIPVVQMLQAHRPKISRGDGTYAIVIVPTRELAIQSLKTFQNLVQPFQFIVPGALMGGEKKKSEKGRLRRGLTVLVATPGRLLDHLEHTASLELGRVKYLVIDEADRLLDLGFEKEVAKIVSCLDERGPARRQTILLSATLSSSVERLAGMTLRDPVKVDITQASKAQLEVQKVEDALFGQTDTEKFATPERLHHYFVVVPSKLRLVTLIAFILEKCKFSKKQGKMIIFLATQVAVDFHHIILDQQLNKKDKNDNDDDDSDDDDDENDVEVWKLHGDMAQKDRTRVYQQFCAADSGVLLSTDVAARGLDLPHVNWIIQYNTPGSPTDYIHRAGRTARIGTQGSALLFLTPSEVDYVKVLSQHKISMQELKMDDLLKTLLLQIQLLPKHQKRKGVTPHTIQECATALQMDIENFISDDVDARNMARKAYQSFVRAYATYPANLKHIFHIKHLHLGHLAKSFGLKDAPTAIGDYVGKYGKAIKKENKFKKSFKPKTAAATIHIKNIRLGRNVSVASEFASGLGGSKPPSKLKHKVTKKKKKSKPK